jgi:hypothetical protein
MGLDVLRVPSCEEAAVDPLFDLLLILGALSLLYGGMAVLAGLAERSAPLIDRVRRSLG